MRADQECGIHSARRIARGASRCTIWNPCTRVEKDQAFFASGAPGAVLKHRIPQHMGLSSRPMLSNAGEAALWNELATCLCRP
jgi:hypothetical protein